MSETKNQSATRAKEIARLQRAIKDAPDAIALRNEQLEIVAHFENLDGRFSANDWDGFMRTFGGGGYDDIPDNLRTKDEAMIASRDRDESSWAAVSKGYIGVGDCAKVRAFLLPSERAYLVEVREMILDEIESIREHLPEMRSVVATLISKGRLPEAIADKFGLLPTGELKPTQTAQHEERKPASQLTLF